MIDMRSWKALMVDVLEDIHLDPRNVRLGTDVTAPEPDIMADLFRNEKALELVESIIRVGYLTHEVPIVLVRDESLIVVEGNRRVAALKAIQNPYLVPEYQARISALVTEIDDRDLLRRIEVKRAPSQDEADQLIAALHTGNPRVQWSPARKAAFFEAQIDQGKTLKQLRAQYPTSEADKYVFRSGILNLFRGVSYQNPAHVDLLSSRGNATSTLARVYESKSFIELTGLRMDEHGTVHISVPSETFAEMAELIVGGIADGDINTRTIGTKGSARYLKLIDDLKDIAAGIHQSSGGENTSTESQQPETERSNSKPSDAPATSNPTSGGKTASDVRSSDHGRGSGQNYGSEESSSDSRKTQSDTDSKSENKRGNKKPSPALDVGSLAVPTQFPDAVHILLRELSAINVNRFPNATFDLMRTFLEKSIKALAEARGVDLKPKGHAGFVYLKNCLQWMQEEVESNGPKYLVQVLKQIQSGKVLDFTHSSDFLNALNHNHHVSVSPDEVRRSWSQMKSVLAEVLK